MRKREKVYYCNQCKRIFHQGDHIFFVEQGHLRGYCSEKCTTRFFSPLMKYLEEEETFFRKELGLEVDISLTMEEWEAYAEESLKKPDEIWMDGQDSTERIYYFFNDFEKAGEHFHLILGVLFSEYGPGFVLWQTVTRHHTLLNVFRTGERIQNFERSPNDPSSAQTGAGLDLPSGSEGETALKSLEEDGEKLVLDPKEMEQIEGRRSFFLAKLMQERSDDDIPYEFFHQYEPYVQNTLEGPDEVYRQLEPDGETIFTYIKSFQVEETSFFYIVLCLHYRTDRDSGEETLIPIISFPSVDGDLYYKYKRGEKISGVLKN